MKKHWERIAEKIDALSLRERGLVFFSLAMVLFMLLYSSLIRPVVEQQRIVARSLSEQESQIRVANQQLGVMITGGREDPDTANRRRLDDLKRRLALIRQELAQRQSMLVAADRMSGLLEDLVARHRRLELVDLKTLPPTSVTGTSDAPTSQPGESALERQLKILAPTSPNGASEAPRRQPGESAAERQRERAAVRLGRAVFRHGVELTVQGSYFDLLDYVRELERLPTQLIWGRVDLTVDEYPKVTMKLTLYTLSLDRAWLIV